MTVEKELECVTHQANINITKDDVTIHFRKMLNWKAPNPDGFHGFWLKKFPSFQQAMVKHLDNCLETWDVPNWMIESCWVLIQKDAKKGNAVGSYRPIACLNLLWKLLISITNEKVYDQLNQQNLVPEEQKGCRRKTRGTKDQLLIDKPVVRNSRRMKTNINGAWINFRKTYDMLSHSLIQKRLELVGTTKNIVELLKKKYAKFENSFVLWKKTNKGKLM